jgi:capping protein beta
MKKVADGAKNIKGSWDSIHVVEVQERGRNATYKLTSTIMLYLLTSGADSGDFNLAGSLTRQVNGDITYLRLGAVR